MRILSEKPPIYEEAKKLFNLDENRVIFFTYGDTIFSPTGKMPTSDLIVHEETHAEQQGHNPTVAKLWWQRYFLDENFRMEQEAEAYGNQYRFLCRHHKDRNSQARILSQFATFLSGEVYGRCISFAAAMQKIKSYADGTALSGIEDHMDDNNDVEI